MQDGNQQWDTRGGSALMGMYVQRGTPAAKGRIARNWGGGWVCVCVVGSGEEGHEAEIALRIHYARLSS